MSWHPEIERALAELRADSEDEASDAAAALGWLVGEEGPERLSEGRLQEFLWSVLPSKFLMPLESQLEVATALARALDVLGLPRYAEVCRDPRVEHILEPVAELLVSAVGPPPPVDAVVWRLQWLLREIGSGVALRQPTT
jgi:hypothetical protein